MKNKTSYPLIGINSPIPKFKMKTKTRNELIKRCKEQVRICNLIINESERKVKEINKNIKELKQEYDRLTLELMRCL